MGGDMETIGQRVRAMRLAKDISLFEVAHRMGMSRPTYTAVETGIRQLTIPELQVLAGILGSTIEDILLLSSNIGMKDSTLGKYKQIILNCIQYGGDTKDGKLTKTKLAKLVYLSDFAWFYDHRNSMSGLTYRRIQQGPVPDEYFRAVDELFGAGSITITPSGTALMINATDDRAPTNKLSPDEIELIRKVSSSWKDKNTQEVVDFTHNQKPWLSCKQGELVPYELILEESRSNLY
jgi:transcriptional regulator with XRE-family HTH domain